MEALGRIDPKAAPYEASGIWRLKDKTQYHGTLRIADGKIRLTVTFGKMPNYMGFRRQLHDVRIEGELSDGHLITLPRCFEMSSSQGMNDFLVSEFECESVLFGAHVDDLLEESCTAITAVYDLLAGWFEKRAYASASRFEDERHEGDFSIRWSGHQVLLEQKLGPAHLKLYWLNRPEFLSKDFMLVSSVMLELRYQAGTPFKEVSVDLEKTRWLLSFLFGTPAKPIHISADIGTGDDQKHIVIAPPWTNRDLEKRNRDLATSFEELQEELPRILGKWVEVSERYFTLLSLLFSPEALRNPSIKFRFLYYIQLVEHVYALGERRGLYEDFQALKTRLLSVLEEVDHVEFKSVAKQRLSQLNDPSIRGKIRAVLSSFHKRTVAAVGLNDDMVGKIAVTRNQLTHPERGRGEKLLADGEMWRIEGSLRALFYLLLLKELGFTERDAVHSLGTTDLHRDFIDMDEYNSAAYEGF